ncbi:MAG: Ppx/GppA family phosphatase [Chromatiales bacterium]|nr:Ppx/GppA family phosphatase [Chromatiales bacterium]
MMVARVVDGHLVKIDGLRQPVRLAAGLDDNKNISEEAQQRAIACLEIFGQRVQGLPEGHVRAVGTNTLRQARNGSAFLYRAEAALGHPIEIIGGVEEARLIYLGVAHGVADSPNQRRLVVDIGGGSTELILGEQFDPQELESLHMGCVSSSQRFFPDGVITKEAMNRAELAAQLELRPIANRYRRIGWGQALGASGTIKSLGNVVREMGCNEFHITFNALKRVRKAMLEAGHIDKLELKGLNDDRRPVFPGGVVVLYSVFKSLGIDEMVVSPWALREGLIFDLQGRTLHEDVRAHTVGVMRRRYHADALHGRRVAEAAKSLWRNVGKDWGLDREDLDWLMWAARLHEIGIAVSHSSYHKHGAYLLANSDMPGFSRYEQRLLGILVRLHRRKLGQSVLDELPEEKRTWALRLVVILRLAVLLCRERLESGCTHVEAKVKENGISLKFPDEWLAQSPLTVADLEQEKDYLGNVGIKLKFA